MDGSDKINGQSAASGYKSVSWEKTSALHEQIESFRCLIEVQKAKIIEYYWLKYAESGECDQALQAEFAMIKEYIGKIADVESDIQIIIDGNNQLLQQPVMIPDIMGQYNADSGLLTPDPFEVSQDTSTPRMSCHVCGAALPKNAKFCLSCGASILRGPEIRL
jgi:ribosomal protein L40E